MAFPSKTDRDTILAAAMEQIAGGGLRELSLRGLAAALKLAPNALYRYFNDRASLEAALAEESLRRLHVALRRAAGKKTPEHAIRSIAMAYVRFAREEPEVFALTLMPDRTHANGASAHIELWIFVLGQVNRIYGEARAPEAAVTLWAFLHGMTALEAAHVFGKQKPASSFDFGLRMWLNTAKGKAS